MTAYGERALDSEIDVLRRCGNGARNGQLNRSAFAIAQLVAGKQIEAASAKQRLWEAAEATGLDVSEIKSTLNSGWKAGLAEPRADRADTDGDQVERYPYHDASGRTLYAKARVDRADMKYQYQHFDGRRWKAGRGGITPVPYRLAHLSKAAADVPLYMAEGEKHADKLASWGLLATSLKDWRRDFAQYVAGRIVFILPDNDDDGAQQAAKAVKLVSAAGGTPYIVELPGLPHRGDIINWAGTAEDLKALVEAAMFERIAPVAPPPKEPAYKRGISATALMAKKFDPINYIVPGLIAEGATLFAGKPKIGKSWMAYDIAIAVASGRPLFGKIPVTPGDVLYLALEDSERRLKSRLLTKGVTAPERLTLATEWPGLDEGCIAELEAWAESASEPALVIIDVLKMVRGVTRGTETQYDADYRALTGLASWARTRRIAVLIVHHVRKMEADDPLESISGTNGLTGAADTVMVLKRDIGTPNCTLYVRGRDVEEAEKAVRFMSQVGTWELLGEAQEVGRTDERHAILEVLRANDNQLSARDISDILGKNYDAVRKCVARMAHAGEVQKSGRGMYTCPNGPNVPNTLQMDIGTHGTGGVSSTRAIARETNEDDDPAVTEFIAGRDPRW